jgi:hypothetical protein
MTNSISRASRTETDIQIIPVVAVAANDFVLDMLDDKIRNPMHHLRAQGVILMTQCGGGVPRASTVPYLWRRVVNAPPGASRL